MIYLYKEGRLAVLVIFILIGASTDTVLIQISVLERPLPKPHHGNRLEVFTKDQSGDFFLLQALEYDTKITYCIF